MSVKPTPFDRIRGPAGWGMRHLYRFAEVPLRRIEGQNDTHWRRGGGTFLAFCPMARVDAWSQSALPQRAATVVRAAVGVVAQLGVSLTDGVLAGCALGLLLAAGRKEAAREVAAQHFYPLGMSLLTVHAAVCLGLMVGIFRIV